jgi:hypothetical protein
MPISPLRSVVKNIPVRSVDSTSRVIFEVSVIQTIWWNQSDSESRFLFGVTRLYGACDYVAKHAMAKRKRGETLANETSLHNEEMDVSSTAVSTSES